MLESLEIENFRGIKKLKIDNFKNINFFIGKANTSKTSLLEAILISLSQSPYSISLSLFFRGFIKDDDIFDSLFYDYDTTKEIYFNFFCNNKEFYINLKNNNENNEVVISFNDNNKIINNKLLFIKDKNYNNPPYLIFDNENGIVRIYNSINANIYYEFITNENTSLYMALTFNLKIILSDKNKSNIFKNMYKQFDDKIKDIKFIGKNIVVEFENLNHTVNIKSMGKGFQTYISIIASMVAGKKYIIIDEIENGMHFESIKLLLENILALSKEYGLQFFITTHNKELLEILNDCLIEKDYKDMLSVYNVYYNKENNIDVINYSQENFSNLIENNNEMRD
ncbi:AAA family ATPase [uncultured Brachyspira sp.]|uniref:AAA family ATPase n=1 Tax=uncultured Brachyspira sp. TaxID=221953 RepID=UPI002603A6DB|nr:AAA family ATPase [uncultured Brachyspira sp.]